MTFIPHRIPAIIPKMFSSLLWRMPNNEKNIYLTFDDGPVPGPTEFVINTLKSFEASATFFCIGENVQRNQNLFRQIIAGGYSIGNHTFNHLKGWSTPVEKYLENVKECDRAFSTTVDGFQPTKLFRPPYGRITPRQVRALKNYRIVMWDVLTLDYLESELNKKNLLKGSIQVTRPGSIVVFHDSYRAEKNLYYLLPRYLEHFLGLGYEFKAL